MEKFLWILLFSRLFPAPLWLWPFDCMGMQGRYGSTEGRIFSKAKKGVLYPFAKHEVLRFPHGPNLQFICFPMLYSHCNMPPARQCAECEAVKKKFYLLPLFSLIFSCSFLVPLNPPCLKPAHPRAPASHCLTSAHPPSLLTPEMVVGLLLPNVIVKSKSELALPSCPAATTIVSEAVPLFKLHLHKMILEPDMETEQQGHMGTVCSERKYWRQ